MATKKIRKPDIDESKVLAELENTDIKPRKADLMGENLKKLLEEELKNFKKREKSRAAEMIGIFSAHNYYASGFTPYELRTTLEDLGPTYVKIGQIMSSRPDMLPEAYCKELEKLRQNVKPLDPQIARAVIEDETGKKIEEIYSEFRDEPLGSASIGQVHYGVLKDGTQVVTKVQRPLISDMMHEDFILLKKLADLVHVISSDPDNETIDLKEVIVELEKVTEDELDFRVEAENTKFFKANCIENEEEITCPDVIDELTTSHIYTMTYVDGCSVSKKDRLIEEGCDVNGIGAAIVNNFVHQILDVGTFHADPHQGNIMVAHGKPYWIDFGMIGRIGKKEIDLLTSMIIAIIGEDVEGVVDGVMAMGSTSSLTNRDKLVEDAEIFMKKFNSSTSIADLDMSEIFTEIMDLASKHHIKLPGEYTMLARSVLAIEGVIEQLCPELNLVELITNKLTDRLKKSFDIKQTLLDAGKSLISSGKKAAKIPDLCADALSGLAKGRTKINMEITGLDEPLAKIGVFVRNVVLTLVACVMFIGACILSSVDITPKTANGMPLIAVVLMVCSVALGIHAIKQMTTKKNK